MEDMYRSSKKNTFKISSVDKQNVNTNETRIMRQKTAFLVVSRLVRSDWLLLI